MAHIYWPFPLLTQRDLTRDSFYIRTNLVPDVLMQTRVPEEVADWARESAAREAEAMAAWLRRLLLREHGRRRVEVWVVPERRSDPRVHFQHPGHSHYVLEHLRDLSLTSSSWRLLGGARDAKAAAKPIVRSWWENEEPIFSAPGTYRFLLAGSPFAWRLVGSVYDQTSEYVEITIAAEGTDAEEEPMSAERENKLLMGRVLGELFRIQRKLDMPCAAGDQDIYGLIAGIEPTIDDVVNAREAVDDALVREVAAALDYFFNDPERLKKFRGYYDLESQLQQRGFVDAHGKRGWIVKILDWFAANGRYQELIDKMDSSHSPIECKKFGPNEYEK
jgi:hypothetical protein